MLSIELLASTWNSDFIAAIKRHYTGSSGPPPGKKLAWRIVEDGVVRGFIGLGEPAFKLAPRRRLGIETARPLERTVCCFIFRLEAPGASKASAILKAWHEQAALDWLVRYGWMPEHWETLVDASVVAGSVPGACFRSSGYRSLGETTGRSARRPPGHTHGPRVWGNATPKLVLYRGPLARLPG